jgi:hypothetical protein
LRHGVKKGDPLSPYIFNAMMYHSQEQLEEFKGYATDDINAISSLAFADDLLFIVDSCELEQRLIAHMESYLHQLGMQQEMCFFSGSNYEGFMAYMEHQVEKLVTVYYKTNILNLQSFHTDKFTSWASNGG